MSTEGQIMNSKMDCFDKDVCLHLNNEKYYGTCVCVCVCVYIYINNLLQYN